MPKIVLRKINFKLLEAYRKVYGNIHVESNFLIPKTAQFPPEFHDYNIGKYVEKIRIRGLYDKYFYEPDDLKKVDDMGLNWNDVVKPEKKSKDKKV